MRFVDEVLTGIFSRHADDLRHTTLRFRYRATSETQDFPVFVSRLYGLSWFAFALVAAGWFGAVQELVPQLETVLLSVATGIPIGSPAQVVAAVPVVSAGLLGIVAKRTTFIVGDLVVALRYRKRREYIEETLPRTVRYMHVLAAGGADERTIIEHVADQPAAFGETATAFQRVRGSWRLTGSVDRALRIVARNTPSRQVLAPFLLTFRARAREGSTSLAEFLLLESRMLARHDAQQTGASKRYLRLVVQLFVTFLVLPALAVVGFGLATGLGEGDVTSMTAVHTVRRTVLYSPASALAILGLGAVASGLVVLLRPSRHRWSRFRPDDSLRDILVNAHRNPADALFVLLPVGIAVAIGLAVRGRSPVIAGLMGYVVIAIPVGLVDHRRARLDAAKDRYLPDLLYELGHQVHLGRSFTEAVERVASDARLGPLNGDVADLAFDLQVATGDRPVRGAALERFVDRVGTPLAARTVGLVAGALDAGSQTAAAFDALQSEAGRLYHEERAVRDRLSIFLAVGWVVAFLVVGIVVTINAAALGTTVPPHRTTGVLGAVAVSRTIPTTAGLPTFFLLTQATMLSSGWFAGVAGRGVYEGLLHSGALVLTAMAAFATVGLI